jgi:recombination protein RecR
MIPESIKRFVARFSRLPSIGPRQATRLAFYLVHEGQAAIADASQALSKLGSLGVCAECFMPFEPADAGATLCTICSNPERRADIIAIVEEETDLLSLEQSKRWPGRYFILGEVERAGVLSAEQKLRLQSLAKRLGKSGGAAEIVVALSPTTAGNLEAASVIEQLRPFAKKITRLGRGLPTGGEVEFADEETLGAALENRR